MIIITVESKIEREELLVEDYTLLLRKKHLNIFFEFFDKINIRKAKFPIDNRKIKDHYLIGKGRLIKLKGGEKRYGNR